MIQPNYGKICSVDFKRQETRVKVECAFTQTEQIKKPISVFASAYLTSCEEVENGVKVKAKVLFTMVYLSEDGYKKTVAESDFNEEISFKNASVTVSAVDARLIGNGPFGASCYLVFTGEQKTSEEKSILCGGDGIFTDSKLQKYDVYYNNRKGQQVVTEEFELDFTVGEVLSYGATAYINQLSCGLGKIILEGEVVLTVKALPFSENNDIVKEVKIIPYRYELDDEDSLPDMRAVAKAEVVATNIKVYSDEGKNKSSVTADITLAFLGNSVGEEEVTVVKDCYLKENESEVLTSTVKLTRFKEQKCCSEKFIAQGVNSLDGGRIITTLGDGVSVVGVKNQDGRVFIDGIVHADVIFKNADNGITSIKNECPFSVEFAEENQASIIGVVLCDLTARVRNGEIEFEGRLKIYYKTFSVENIDFVEEIAELDKRRTLGGSICVYVPSKGDTLWDVSKNLGADGEEILKFNEDLEFPLTGEERIIVYRQKD